MRRTMSLGRIFGIPIRLHSSWLLIAALVTWSLARGFFPREYPNWDTTTYWVVGAVTALLFFASVLLHELAHSVLALRAKVPVLNITLFIFGGVAQIEREPPTPGAEFRIALAGPLASLGLAGLFSLLGRVVAEIGTLSAPLAYLGRINLTLALFNMIPGFPLDGGRVLRAVLWGLGGSFRTATRWATLLGRGLAFLFIFVGAVEIFLGSSLNGLWIAFIGWFLNTAAESSYQQVVLRDVLTGVTVSKVMAQQCITVPSDLRLDRLIEDHVLGAGQRCFFVADTDELQGLITMHNIKRVPRDRRDKVTVGQIMTPVDALFRARPEEDLFSLLQKMDGAQVNQVPVMDNGHLLGIITRENLLHYIRQRSELGL
jgi:Zn-dependent protease